MAYILSIYHKSLDSQFNRTVNLRWLQKIALKILID